MKIFGNYHKEDRIMRETGILMPVSSLPSRTGVGELGRETKDFLDYLKEAGVKIWQILPLNPVGYGNSPYQPYSSCAGDEIYISLETLYEQGLLKDLPPAFLE
jgi:4-alpha-glucanotransferase